MDATTKRETFRHIVTALALVGDAADRVRYGPSPLTRVDREVVAEQLEAAIQHVLNALDERAHWRRMSEAKRVWALRAYGDRHRRQIPDPGCVPCLVVGADALLRGSYTRLPDGSEAVELGRALSHLVCALLLVVPETLHQWIADSPPERRVAMGEWLREVREDVDEARRLVRSRLGG